MHLYKKRFQYLQLKQLWIGSPCKTIWHKEIWEEEHGDPCSSESHGESVDSQQRGVRSSAESSQQWEHVSWEQPHLSGLHQEGTECAENNLT